MKTIDDMHSFVNYAEPLKNVESHRKMMENMSRLTMEAAYFIRDYTVNKDFCEPQICSKENIDLTSHFREAICKAHFLGC